MFDPIINPTLKNANFGPKILVKPKDRIVNKINIMETNKKSFFIIPPLFCLFDIYGS